VRLKAKFRVPRFDLEKYKAALHAKLSEALAQAAFRWLSTVDAIIPAWSGASRATLSALASMVGYSLLVGGPVEGAPDRVSVGLDHGSATFECNQSQAKYSFSYVTTLPWLIINEYYDARQWDFHLKRPGPYHFQEAATKALESYLSTELEDLPSIRAFITTETVSMG
jgi:hypothetical protein